MADTPASAVGNTPFSGIYEPQDDSPKSPIVIVHRNRVVLRKQPVSDAQVQQRRTQIQWFFNTRATTVPCYNAKHPQRKSSCTCLMDASDVLDGEAIASIVDYLYYFGLLEKEEQSGIIKEWIKYAESAQLQIMNRTERKRAYLLPGSTLLICKDALCKLLGLGHDAWSTYTKLARKNLPLTHGLANQPSNNRDKEMDAALQEYFERLQQLLSPRSTLLIRTLVSDKVETELRGDEDDMELPSHFTKKSLFNQLLAEFGWKYTYDAKGRTIKKEEIDDIEQKEL